MSFVVMESYTCKPENIKKMQSVFIESISLFDNIEGIENIEILEELENSKIVGITTWKSRETFNNFLKSEQMMSLLESDLMETVKELMTSFDMKMYNKMELKK